MTNREFYKEQILDIALNGKNIGVDKKTLEPCDCRELNCCDCMGCSNLNKWANAEYVEPCPFEKDELVEVSDNEKKWYLRYFSHQKDGTFYCYDYQLTSQETNGICPWIYCRKYGTLGGLVAEHEKAIKPI